MKALAFDNAQVIVNGTDARLMGVGDTAAEGVLLQYFNAWHYLDFAMPRLPSLHAVRISRGVYSLVKLMRTT